MPRSSAPPPPSGSSVAALRSREGWPSGSFAARLSESSCRDLLGLSVADRVPAGTVLIRQGDPSISVYLLRPVNRRAIACAKVAAVLENGHDGLLGIRVSGDIVGELGVVRSARRTATVTTCAPTLVHAIAQDIFLRFLAEHPDAWRAVSATIADRLEWANQWRLEYAAHDVLTRVARILLMLAERHGHPTPDGQDLGLPISQEELGHLIGAHRDTVVKCVALLRSRHLIKTAYRRIIITNPGGLRALAQIGS
jgi:CRP/FNR family transcriptional regulator, cyclic AMP receptor protein